MTGSKSNTPNLTPTSNPNPRLLYVDPRIDERKVLTVRVVIDEPESPTSQINHWSIYLLLKDGVFVHVNMEQRDKNDLTGTLSFAKDTIHSTTTPEEFPTGIKHFDYTAKHLVVKDVYDTLVEEAKIPRHRYMFTNGKVHQGPDYSVKSRDIEVQGDGARFWVYTAIRDLDHKRYLVPIPSTTYWSRHLKASKHLKTYVNRQFTSVLKPTEGQEGQEEGNKVAEGAEGAEVAKEVTEATESNEGTPLTALEGTFY